MKNLTYHKKDLKSSRGRAVSIRELTPEADCDTAVRKSFVYLTSRADAIPAEMPAPEVRVIKSIDTDKQQEKFRFRVKGVVYFKKDRFICRVDYLHSLSIRMLWKTHVLSSKPAVLA